jgi:hypothetical protein
MDTTDLLLLVIGIGCLSAAFAALMRDPEPTPEPEPLVKDAAPLAYGGVVQRAKPAVPPLPHKAFVVGPVSGRKCELDPEDGTVSRIIDPVYRAMHHAKGPTDDAIIECITALWRPEPTTPEAM